VQTTAPPQQRTLTTATLVAAGGALPDGVPEALRPPAGVDVLADAGAGALALRVGDQADAALNYYVGRLGANSYELVRLDDRNDGKPAVLFGDVHEGGTITITGSGASTQLLVSVTQFPTTPTLPKPFAMPGGAFRFGYDVTNDVAHHHLFLPKYAKDDSINALSSAAQSAGYTTQADETGTNSQTASIKLTGYGATARLDISCSDAGCAIDLYRTS